MRALGFVYRVRSLPVALFGAALFAFGVAPAVADTVPAAAAHPQAKRAPASFVPVALAGKPFAGSPVASGVLYFPGTPNGVNIGGRLNVGKSHVYVPYYGTISNDPAHPGVQGSAGLAYGFRTWDIGIYNNALGQSAVAVPGADQSKINPSLAFSIRF